MATNNDIRHLVVAPDAAGVPQARKAVATTMEALGWQERRDLQRFLRSNSDVLEPGLLLITEEFDSWEGGSGRIADRLDLLFLDGAGRPLLVELKRGNAPDRTESQALQYAAYCDGLRTQELAELLREDRRRNGREDITLDEATAEIEAHAESLTTEQPGRVRIRLVAEGFPSAVTATVLFLRSLGSTGGENDQLDIGCLKMAVQRVSNEQYVLSFQPIIPLPETESYLVRRRKRDAVEVAERDARTRIPNAVPLLQERGAIAADSRLQLNWSWLTSKAKEAIEKLIGDEPSWEFVTWTATAPSTRAVRFGDDPPTSIASHYNNLRIAAGINTAPDATSAFVVEGSGKTLRELADELLEADN